MQTPTSKGRRHEVRLIGGRWKRSKLPVADIPGLRPTPDRVRETLFNWLGRDLEGWRCLDAFAGSGALGLEAASRGAGRVVLVERERALAENLRAVVKRLNAELVEVVCDDALSVMRRAQPDVFDLILLDPPYGSGLLEPALTLAKTLVPSGGYAYVEDAQGLEAHDGWSLVRQDRAGMVHYHLLQRD